MQQIGNDRRQTELLEGQELVWNPPQHHADVTALFEDGDAKPSLVTERESKVRPADFLKLLLVALGSDTLHQTDCVFGSQCLRFQADQMAPDSHYRRLARRDVQVAHFLTNDRL